MSEIFYFILYHFIRLIVIFTPQFLQNAFFKLLAYLFYKFDKKHTNIMRVNIGLCFSEFSQEKKEEIIRKTYENYAFFATDFIKNQNSTKDKILSKIQFKNEEILLEAMKQNRPIIVQTAHYGNWELLSLAMAAKFGAVSIIGRKLDSKIMDKILKRNRTKFDIKLIPKNGGIRQILSALKNKRLLGILVDQNTAKKDGIDCIFFGKKILHTPAASVFGSKTNSIIIPAFIKKIANNKNEICFFNPIDISQIEGSNDDKINIATQMQSDATMNFIKEKPDEYFWFHKKFKHYYEELYK